ncbi:MAG: protein kinase [Oscillospiraceae bacterium]|nr:protein kinase [Oscillospiraceae bacterium]
MSKIRLVSPLLDNFLVGDPISQHHGIRCCPAIEQETDEKYILKIISVPATPSQMDALLLSGAYNDESSALEYFRQIADEIVGEVSVLENLAQVEGFIPFSGYQVVPMESGKGFEIYILSKYKRTLSKHFKKHIFTHLDALNLGLDLCASLSVCRRNGYIYADLKPNNILVTDQRLFRIGDLGFFAMDSLKYASLPEKYQSIYTPPEIRDAFSALNATIDIYAAGLILYQTYNNGELPFNDEIQPGDKLPAPLYADYEMSEIILKACDPTPENRWQDPMQMGQAIVSYMQRNGANDIPIVPMPVQDEITEESVEESEEEISEIVAEESVDADSETINATESVIEEDTSSIEETSAEESDTESTEVLSFEESQFNDTENDNPDLPAAEEILEELGEDYNAITDEVTDILSQADELAELEVPEPVIVPDHIELVVPEPHVEVDEEIIEEITESTEPAEQMSGNEDDEPIAIVTPADEFEELFIVENNSEHEYSDDFEDIPKKNIPWVRYAIIAFAIIALLIAGIYYYRHHYLLPIDHIDVQGDKDTLTVFVTTDIDESLLQVICSDTFGNKIPAPVIDGKAEFTGLVPNTAYSVKVNAKGFHRLTGNISTAYSTPIQSNIVQFDAITGTTQDSVVLSFTVEGPSCNEWDVVYSADGEDDRVATFDQQQMVTITDLTVGKEYTFTLRPKQPLYITGLNQIKFTPQELIRAEKLEAISCINNTLTVKWSAPEGAIVSGWSVRCHNDSYSQTIVTTDTVATFQDLDHTAEYDIEVKAVGMSVGEKIFVSANSVTVTDFKVDTSVNGKFTFTWQASQPVPEDGWILRYSIIGTGREQTISCASNSVVIDSVVPNATYTVQLEDIKGNVLLGSKAQITSGNAPDLQEKFNSFTLTRGDLTFQMCKTPSRPNWGRYDLSASDYRTEFSVGESASYLVRTTKGYHDSKKVTTLFVIRNEKGTPIIASSQTKSWSDMWSNYNCKLEIPSMPATPGTYTIEIYFNSGLAHTQSFKII